MDAKLLLSDGFMEFSKKVEELRVKKNNLTEEMKQLVAKHKADMKEIEDQVNELQQNLLSGSNQQSEEAS